MVNLTGKQAAERAARPSSRAWLAATLSISALTSTAIAQPVFDGTTGNQAPGTVATDTIDVAQGTRAGGNVFHSFSSFSIPAGQTVTFTDQNSTTPVNNIINRVSGTDVSQIDGRLDSFVSGANFYLINPNGIVVGAGGSINVPAGLYLSTADELRFADGEVLRASVGSSTFTSTAPQSFGFTNATIADIAIDGDLFGPRKADIGIVGGDLTVHGSVTTFEGMINLVSVAGVGQVAIDPTTSQTTVTSFGDIELSGTSSYLQSTALDTPRHNGVSIAGNNIRVANGTVGATVNGLADSEGVRISATGDVTIEADAIIYSPAFSTGMQGGVDIDARNIRVMSGGRIIVYSNNASSGRGVVLTATDNVELIGQLTGSTTYLASHYGISVHAARFAMSDHARLDILRSLHADPVILDIEAGEVSIRDSLLFYDDVVDNSAPGGVQIDADTVTFFNSDFSIVSPAGFFRIDADSVSFLADTNLTIVSGQYGFGSSDVEINARNSIRLDASRITTEATDGTSGDIVLTARDVLLDNFSTLLTTATFTGVGGDITITANEIGVNNGSLLTTVSGSSAGAGDIFLDGDRLVVSGGKVSVDSLANQGSEVGNEGPAGNLFISTNAVRIENGGVLSATAFGAGNAGTITVCCGTSFEVTGANSRVVAGTGLGSSGDAGRVLISAKEVKLTDGGRMTVATEGAGRGGEIWVRANIFTAEDAGSGLATVSGASGVGGASAGRIQIEAGIFNLLNGAVITTDTAGDVPAGTISLRSSELNIKGDNTVVSSRSTANGDAGNIDIGTVNFTLSQGASFSTLAQNGAGGNILFAWNGIGRITDASVTTQVLGGTGGGGTIEFGTRPVEPLDFDTIFRNICGADAASFSAYDGGLPRYDPASTARPVLLTTNATINASAQQGTGGTVIIGSRVTNVLDTEEPPEVDVSSNIGRDGTYKAPTAFQPASPLIVPERNVTTRCAGREQNNLSDDLTGRANVGTDPAALMPAGLDNAERTLAAAAARLCAPAA